jgi:TPR repeat protein
MNTKENTPVPVWFHEDLESIVRLVKRWGLAGLKKNRFSEVLVRGNENGSVTAKFLLGHLYEYLATREVCVKRGDGVSLILESAELGYQDAVDWCIEHIIAFFLEGEQGYRPYIVDMCKVAATGGDPRAQLLYGLILMEGELVPRNKAMSDYWVEQALGHEGFDPEAWMESLAEEFD